MKSLENLEFNNKVLAAENEYLKNILNIASAKKQEKGKFTKFKKKLRIGLVVDVENWAYANIARNFKENISDFDFTIVPMSLINGNVLLMWILLKDCDIVHFFCRGLPLSINSEDLNDKITKYHDTYENFYKNYLKGKILTTCVYDHLFLDEDFDFTQLLFSKIQNYYVSSNILYNIYNSLDIKYKPYGVITDGINLDIFFPKNLSRFSKNDRKITIGWVGNSKWVNNNDDYKGINTIIKPAIKELQEEGYNVELLTSDKIDKFIPINEMVNYYEKIDIYICASKNEGTPNPVLEAMACGIPVISTNVGIVKDALGPIQQEFIFQDRTKEELKKYIKKMINTDGMMKKCSKENLEYIKKWQWRYKAKEFEEFIKKAKRKGKKL